MLAKIAKMGSIGAKASDVNDYASAINKAVGRSIFGGESAEYTNSGHGEDCTLQGIVEFLFHSGVQLDRHNVFLSMFARYWAYDGQCRKSWVIAVTLGTDDVFLKVSKNDT